MEYTGGRGRRISLGCAPKTCGQGAMRLGSGRLHGVATVPLKRRRRERNPRVRGIQVFPLMVPQSSTPRWNLPFHSANRNTPPTKWQISNIPGRS